MWSRRSSKPVKTSALLDPLIKRLGIANDVRLARIKSDWNVLFEKPLSLHLWPAKLNDGALLLNADSSAWIHQLSYHRNAILSKLEPYGIREIRFRVGKIPSPPPIAPQQPEPVLSTEDRRFLANLTDGVADEDLRRTIRKTVERSLKTAQLRPAPERDEDR